MRQTNFLANLTAVLAHSLVLESLAEVPAGVKNDFVNAFPSSPFEITRRDPAGNASAIAPSASRLTAMAPAVGSTVYARGLALTQDPLDPTAFVPAGPNSFIGFLTRDVVMGGLQLADRVFGRTTPTPTGVAGQFAAGDSVTVEKGMEVELEGPLLLLSGTRSISATTAPGTGLTFESGLVCAAQSGDQVYYTLTATGLPLSVATNTLRIRMEHV